MLSDWPIKSFLFFLLVRLNLTFFYICIRSPPRIPEVIIPEDIVLGVASAFRIEFNRALAILRDIASGRDLKKFLVVC